jgi:pimeloyl-ACP methyl ester carboxylesterase
VSVSVAAGQSEQIRGIVLIGVPGLPQPALSARRVRRWGIRILRRGLQLVRPVLDGLRSRSRPGTRAVEWHTKRFGSKDYLAAGALRPILVRIVNEDLTGSASKIACPALLIWGTDDAETPPWLAYGYQRLIGRRATLALLPHKDHFPFSGTGAHLCGYRLREWLRTDVDV